MTRYNIVLRWNPGEVDEDLRIRYFHNTWIQDLTCHPFHSENGLFFEDIFIIATVENVDVCGHWAWNNRHKNVAIWINTLNCSSSPKIMHCRWLFDLNERPIGVGIQKEIVVIVVGFLGFSPTPKLSNRKTNKGGIDSFLNINWVSGNTKPWSEAWSAFKMSLEYILVNLSTGLKSWFNTDLRPWSWKGYPNHQYISSNYLFLWDILSFHQGINL